MIIAEIGSVHDGSFGNAKKMIDVAKKCGADMVKFQMHIAEHETLKDALKPSYFSDETRFDYFKRISFSNDQWKALINYSKKKKIKFMCSVFSNQAFDKLYNFGVKDIKIPSGELNNLPLINYLSKKKDINIFLSTGMSSWKEIDTAVKLLKKNSLIIMQCTSLYPCPDKFVGLNVITQMQKRYGKDVLYGFSDHTFGSEAAICSIVYGAKFIEKHITFSKEMYGSDAKFAMEPNEFKLFCKSIKKSKKIILSKVDKDNLKPIMKMKKVFEKNIVAKKSIKKGTIIKFTDLEFKKSKKGIKAFNYKSIIGLTAKKNIFKGSLINYKDFLKTFIPNI